MAVLALAEKKKKCAEPRLLFLLHSERFILYYEWRQLKKCSLDVFTAHAALKPKS